MEEKRRKCGAERMILLLMLQKLPGAVEMTVELVLVERAQEKSVTKCRCWV